MFERTCLFVSSLFFAKLSLQIKIKIFTVEVVCSILQFVTKMS